MEENQPLPHCSCRTMSKPSLPLEATSSRRKWSCLTDSITSQTYGPSSNLLESPILVSIVIPITPTITGSSVTEVEPLQLPKDTENRLSEMVTEVVQQEVDPQLEVV